MNKILDFAEERVDLLSRSYRASPSYLGALRIAFGFYILLQPPDLMWVAGLPDAFWQPRPGPFLLLPSVPSPALLAMLEVGQAVAAVALIVGYRTRAVSWVLTAFLVVNSGIVYSFGKVDHFILFEILPVFMAAAQWGAAYSLDCRLGRARRDTNGFPVLCWALFVAFAILTAAVPKALTGWLDPTRFASLGYVARDVADPVKLGPLTGQIFAFQSPVFWKLLDYGTVVLEASLIVAILFPLAFRLCILLLGTFHVGVYLSMGIDFSQMVFVYAPFFSNAALWLSRRLVEVRAAGRTMDTRIPERLSRDKDLAKSARMRHGRWRHLVGIRLRVWPPR